jgi:hypothetical protein
LLDEGRQFRSSFRWQPSAGISNSIKSVRSSLFALSIAGAVPDRFRLCQPLSSSPAVWPGDRRSRHREAWRLAGRADLGLKLDDPFDARLVPFDSDVRHGVVPLSRLLERLEGRQSGLDFELDLAS